MNHIPQYPIALTALMLAASNVFMTFAWYGHLKISTASRSGLPRW